MKTLLSGLLLLASLGATAAQTEVYSEVYGGHKGDTFINEVGYFVNASLGRAAVKFDLNKDVVEETESSRKMVKVPGLFFDKATGEVVLNSTVCATTIRGRRSLKIRHTGNCLLQVTKSKVSIDDGFRIKRKNKISLTITTR